MKIRKKYVLYINDMLGTAYFGNSSFSARIAHASIGEIIDCTLSELKHNIRLLLKRGYKVSKRNY